MNVENCGSDDVVDYDDYVDSCNKIGSNDNVDNDVADDDGADDMHESDTWADSGDNDDRYRDFESDRSPTRCRH
eukprot:3473313-Pyramimonas_sp.AAC.1